MEFTFLLLAIVALTCVLTYVARQVHDLAGILRRHLEWHRGENPYNVTPMPIDPNTQYYLPYQNPELAAIEHEMARRWRVEQEGQPSAYRMASD